MEYGNNNHHQDLKQQVFRLNLQASLLLLKVKHEAASFLISPSKKNVLGSENNTLGPKSETTAEILKHVSQTQNQI